MHRVQYIFSGYEFCWNPILETVLNDAYKGLEKENKVSKSCHSSPDLGSLSSSQQHLGFTASSPIRQLPGRSLERILILERHLQRSFDTTPASYSQQSAYFQTCTGWSQGGVFCVVQFPFFYGLFLYSGIPGILQLQKLPCAGSFRVDKTAFLSI